MIGRKVDAQDAGAPLVTIGMPAYNGARTIERAFASLEAQSWPNLEIVICDDASTDDTAALGEAFAERCARARFYRNKTNLGGYENLAHTLSLAKGEYFVWCCPDDYWDTHFVSDLVRVLEDDPGAVVAMSATEYFCETMNGRELFEVRLPETLWPQNLSPLQNLHMAVSKSGEAGGLKKNSLFLFIQGLVRRELFSDTLQCFDGPIESERQIMGVFAMAGKLIYVDKLSYFKYTPRTFVGKDSDGIAQLVGHAQKELSAKREHLHHQKRGSAFGRTWQTAKAIARSRWIPAHRKLSGIGLLVAFTTYRAVASRSTILRAVVRLVRGARR